jgi:hypothetical protein
MVVGGRSFTSIILQKNCHEFIAYENLITPQTHTKRPTTERARVSAAAGDASLAKALPLVRRALKVLTDREVSPQLGLLKSTLLQLDSTFTERDYGAGTFRDFIEKMASAGYVTLKQVDRSLLVESTDVETPSVPVASEPHAEVEGAPREQVHHEAASHESAATAPAEASASGPSTAQQGGPTPEQVEDAIRNLADVFKHATVVPHWPMYLRNVKQYIKNAAPTFDERKFGFTNFLETIRACQRSGLFRLERNRQGILRVFPGPQFPSQALSAPMSAAEQERATEAAFIAAAEAAILAAEPLLHSSAPVEMAEASSETSSEVSESEQKQTRRRTSRAPGEASKRKPAARSSAAAPRRTVRKKPAADVEGNE